MTTPEPPAAPLAATITLDQLAALPGMPERAILRSLGKGMPADPYAAVQWVLKRWPRSPARREAEAAARIGGLKALGEVPGMPSTPTIRKLIDTMPGFPLIERARGLDPYRIDLALAAGFILSNWRDGRSKRPTLKDGK